MRASNNERQLFNKLGFFGRPMSGVRVVLAVCGLCSANTMALDIEARQLQKNSFEVVLKHNASLTEKEAQSYIAQASVQLCKGLMPMPGKYRFESKQTLGTGTGTQDTAQFTFTQEVSCVIGSLSAAPARVPILSSAEEEKRIRDDIKLRSEAYFRTLAASRFDEAYSQLLESAIGTDKKTWIEDARAFQLAAGKLLSISIAKITVYDNPAEAPSPGLYVAADFQNSYASIPYQCGYIMWYRPVGGTFGITRTETGHVTGTQLKEIPEVQWPELKKKLRCSEP